MVELETVVEECVNWQLGVEVEHEARLVRNVALVGRVSRNGHEYSEEALRSAAGLYDRKPVFLDHAADAQRPAERSTRDLVGSIVNPRFVDGRIRGDIRVLDTESGKTFLALAESDTPGVGMSHVVLARRSKDGTSVERIEDVISVDAVVGPATTTTFRESENCQAELTIEAPETAGESVEDNGLEASDSIEDEITALKRQLSRLRGERDELMFRLAQQESEVQSRVFQQSWKRKSEELGLRAFAVTIEFLNQLEKSENDGTRRELIVERLELLQRAGAERPRSAERDGGAPGVDEQDDARFVSAVRGAQAFRSILSG